MTNAEKELMIWGAHQGHEQDAKYITVGKGFSL